MAFQVENLFTETTFKAVVHLFLILYASRMAPSLPEPVLALFENPFFKLAVYAAILYTASINPTTALLLAIAFMVSMNAINQKKLFEFMENTEEQAPVVEETLPPAATETPTTAAPFVEAPVTEAPVTEAPAMEAPAAEAPVPAPTEQAETPAPFILVTPAPETPAPTPAATQAPSEEICFPIRKYDISKVEPVSFNNYSEFLLSA